MDAYDWYGSSPQPVPTVEVELKDGRRMPIAYPNVSTTRDLSTGCTVNGKWEECKFGRKSPYGTACTYYRFGIMCDKIVDKEGKEYN